MPSFRQLGQWGAILLVATAAGCASESGDLLSKWMGAQGPQKVNTNTKAPEHPFRGELNDCIDPISVLPEVPFTPESLVGKRWAEAERLAKANGWWAVVVCRDDSPRQTIAYSGHRIEVFLKGDVVSGVCAYNE